MNLPCSTCNAACCYSPALLPSDAKVIRKKYVHLKIYPHPLSAHLSTLGKVGMKCPALHGNRCSIYDDRPAVCHQFGIVKAMPCPKVKNEIKEWNRA